MSEALAVISFISETKIVDWPLGEMRKFVIKLEKHFKMTTTTGKALKQKIKREKPWIVSNGQEIKNKIIWNKLNEASLRYQLTSLISQSDIIGKCWI